VSTRINQTDIEKRSTNREPIQQQGLVPVQQGIQRSESLHYNMEETESDTDSKLSARFQDSNDSSVETEQKVM
jgi:hypothetical protein